MTSKVRTFIDFLVEHFERMDYKRKWTSFDLPQADAPGAKGGKPRSSPVTGRSSPAT